MNGLTSRIQEHLVSVLCPERGLLIECLVTLIRAEYEDITPRSELEAENMRLEDELYELSSSDLAECNRRLHELNDRLTAEVQSLKGAMPHGCETAVALPLASDTDDEESEWLSRIPTTSARSSHAPGLTAQPPPCAEERAATGEGEQEAHGPPSRSEGRSIAAPPQTVLSAKKKETILRLHGMGWKPARISASIRVKTAEIRAFLHSQGIDAPEPSSVKAQSLRIAREVKAARRQARPSDDAINPDGSVSDYRHLLTPATRAALEARESA